jgi:hypothetical protein
MGEDMQYKVRLSDGSEFGPAGMELIARWAQEGRVPADALLVPQDGSPVRSVLAEKRLAQIIQAPPTVPGPMARPVAVDGYSGLIPYRNTPALMAYYTGLFSLLPVIGLFLAVPAVILGIAGLRRRAANPEVKGAVHAWIGIIMGGLFTVSWGLTVIAIIAATRAQP